MITTNTLKKSKGYQVVTSWLATMDKVPFAFQKQAWAQIMEERSGLVNAPTGTGKTYSVFLGAVIHFIRSWYSNLSRCPRQRAGFSPTR